VGVQAANDFSSGMASAFVEFADGSKTASQAFSEFAAKFLQEVAEMILQMEILKLVQGIAGSFAGGGAPAGTVTTGTASYAPGTTMGAGLAYADGGIRFAADGIQSVSSPTYFPKFNVVAGEKDMEMMTVLAKPTMRSLGGMDAVVGMAGSRRLAITNADDLERRGGGGAGGTIHIQIDHTPETQATIIRNSVNGAVVEVTKQMKRNSAVSQAVKGLTA
jgi:lambda family phage tail tape measure protein